ncbi:alpha/beta hydrolase [Paraburkholderia sp. USG1]|uniref:alpha/beta hydrolase n=1 Tax=Paraburkholderia sp. USG1 TaxID=2952268 RepID=UPI0028614D1E|nr:alpha/beta hydrolase [Paraburkholderia sp. USG1]MDR8394729.1 alpha/beta hydrolase [Paraburkholderia sp. USG1]
MSGIIETPVDAVVARISKVYRSWGRSTTVGQMRRDWDNLFGSNAGVARVVPVVANGVNGQWISAPGARDDRAVLYFHGGGFQVGSLSSHHELMACISQASGCRVLGVDYRLAPEHRYPSALYDACAAYEWVLAQGLHADEIALAGDSAGAGLVLSTLLSVRDADLPLPAAAVLMSPWTDLTASGESYETRAAADPIHQRPMILAMARNYLGPHDDARDALISPLFADLTGLPPLLIQVGDRETVLSDSTELADRARAAGVTAELQVWDNMIHVFQQFPSELVEARDALQSIGAFLRAHLSMQPISKGN